MAGHLLAISIGPVQDFIERARRTRDLWLGSTSLSEISKAVAKRLKAEGAQLIFPARADADNVANILLAEIGGEDPAPLCASLERAAKDKWKDGFGAEARGRVEGAVDPQRWDLQIDDVVEFYAAWYPLGIVDYSATRQHLMKLLAARKCSRLFKPAEGFEGVPKSSLDGARESVWVNGYANELSEEAKRELRLSPGEQLDAVGVTKRLGSDRHYPSVVRIAADPWLRGVFEKEPTGLARLKGECQKLGRGVIPGVGWQQFEHFPYEGDAVFRNRYPEMAKEAGVKLADLGALSKAVKSLEDDFRVPNPYFAMLAADGDGMGKALGGMGREKHREFSARVAEFAGGTSKILADHNGCLVYSGGDDVLGFVPFDLALGCARSLYESFKEVVSRELTLSVGIAVGHFMDPLEDHLERVRQAEKDAKEPDRNGLAVHFYPHSGAPLKLRSQWTSNLDGTLARLAELHLADRIPDKAGYQLRELSTAYETWPQGTDEDKEKLRSAITGDVRRLIGRKRRSEGDATSPLEEHFTDVATAQDVRRLAEQVIFARRLANVIAQSRGEGRQ